MTEYIIDWDTGLVIDTFSKNNLREEIVRCRDCKHYDEDIHSCDWWSAYERLAEPDGFCAWSERRDADNASD